MTQIAKHTPGPWGRYDTADYAEIHPASGRQAQAIALVGNEDDADLIAVAPEMADAIKGLIGLCQLLRNRDDCPTEIRQALTHNHRLIAAYEALTAAGIDGFQPSDFDMHKQSPIAS